MTRNYHRLSAAAHTVEVNFAQRVAHRRHTANPNGLQLGEPQFACRSIRTPTGRCSSRSPHRRRDLGRLVGRRLYQWFRGQPDRADLDRPRSPRPRGSVTPDNSVDDDRREISMPRSYPGLGNGTGNAGQPDHWIRGSCCWQPSWAPRCQSAFTVANQLPNLIAALVLEATFTAIFVPVLTRRAEREDADGGAAFVRRLMTLAATVLAVATVLSSRGRRCWSA